MKNYLKRIQLIRTTTAKVLACKLLDQPLEPILDRNLMVSQ